MNSNGYKLKTLKKSRKQTNFNSDSKFLLAGASVTPSETPSIDPLGKPNNSLAKTVKLKNKSKMPAGITQ